MSDKLGKIKVTGSPQFHSPQSTSKVMWNVSLALAPASLWSVNIFGLRALLVIAVSILSSVAVEAVILSGKKNFQVLKDGSAFLTGLLIGLNMPPAIPLYIPVVASVFALVVVKWTFGGLGANWMNPALAGRVFVTFSWTGPMTRWTLPLIQGTDALTGPTPLGSLKSALASIDGSVRGPLDVLAGEGVPVSYKELFLGNIPGSLGEISALLLLVGALYLFVRKIISWQIPLSYLLTFSLLVWTFGGIRYSAGFFQGDVLFHLLSGGLILGVFFMATDMVTTPVTAKGRIIYGIGCGFMTFMIRFYGSFPEGVSLAILFMNIFVPLIDRLVTPKRFGISAKNKEVAS